MFDMEVMVRVAVLSDSAGIVRVVGLTETVQSPVSSILVVLMVTVSAYLLVMDIL